MDPITVGMATFEDFDGLYFSVQSIRAMYAHNRVALKELRFVVVDNSPTTKTGSRNKRWLASIPGTKYVPFSGPAGTSGPRDAVFENATTDIVICIDSHVILVPGAIEAVQGYFATPGTERDLVSGPLLFDGFGTIASHFNDNWGAGMWGQWDKAWVMPDKSVWFAVERDGSVALVDATTPGVVRRTGVPWDKCDESLVQQGARPYGFEATDPPIEIPAMGLGMFAAKRLHWPKFCADETATMQGFGGEEHNIHELVRQRGGRCVCLPAAAWIHRFRDEQDRPPYPAPVFDKVRNYYLWALRTGKPVAEVHRRFVLESSARNNRITQSDWEAMEKDPFNPRPFARRSNQRAELKQPPAELTTIKDIFGWFRKQPRDLEKHVDRLREIGNRSKTVVEITKRRESTVAFAASSCALVTHTSEPDRVLGLIQGLREIPMTVDEMPSPYQDAAAYKAYIDQLLCPRAETLFIDALHDGEQLLKELLKFSQVISKWIVVRGTSLFGDSGEIPGSKGLGWAIESFTAQRKAWSVVYVTGVQSGLTVISANGERSVASGGPGTELATLLARLGIHKKASCACDRFSNEMNALGPDGCEADIDRLVREIEANKVAWGWNITEAIKAAGKAILSGLAFQINPANPVESLVRLAIKRSRASLEVDKPLFFLIDMENAQ